MHVLPRLTVARESARSLRNRLSWPVKDGTLSTSPLSLPAVDGLCTEDWDLLSKAAYQHGILPVLP